MFWGSNSLYSFYHRATRRLVVLKTLNLACKLILYYFLKTYLLYPMFINCGSLNRSGSANGVQQIKNAWSYQNNSPPIARYYLSEPQLHTIEWHEHDCINVL